MIIATPVLSGKVHPAAEVFPLIEGTEFDELVESIREHGLLEPLWVLEDGTLLDGRNRLRACAAAGVEPAVRVYRGDDPVGFVAATNLNRRHLETHDRLRIARALKPLYAEQARERQGTRSDLTSVPVGTEVDTGRASQLAADAAGIGRNTLARFERVERAAPELAEAILDGEVTPRAAEEVVRFAPDVIPAIEAGNVTPVEAVEEARERKKAHVAQSSGNNEWYTPPKYLDAARRVLGTIDTDPASSDTAQTFVNATTYYTEETNGLEHPWHGRVWMNQPYAQPLISQFIDKLATDVENGNVTEAIVLVNNGTETAWGQTLIGAAAAVCFPRGRIKFLDSTGTPANTPLQGQMFAYFGTNTDAFAEHFSEIGRVLHA
jgi:hypothetical protein